MLFEFFKSLFEADCFDLNVNLLNLLHFKFRVAIAQYTFEQEDEEMDKNLSN